MCEGLCVCVNVIDEYLKAKTVTDCSNHLYVTKAFDYYIRYRLPAIITYTSFHMVRQKIPFMPSVHFCFLLVTFGCLFVNTKNFDVTSQ